VTFSHRVDGTMAILAWEGVLSPDEQAEIRGLFWADYTEQAVARVLVDLSRCSCLNAATISLLVGAQNIATKVKSRLLLVGAQPENRTLLEGLSLTSYFELHEDLSQLITETT